MKKQEISVQDRVYSIRRMIRGEVDLAIDWAADEGWNPGLRDADCYYSADPDGFLIGLMGEEPIATISVVRYGETFGFLGFYIVKPGYRGNGYGIQIWNAGLEYLKGRNIGLDGVVDQQENYKKSGFRLAYRNIRYEGQGGGELVRASDIIELSTLPFEAVASYSQPFFPEDRSRFISSWIDQEGCHALGVMCDGHLAGYGVIRSCRVGYKIGPLFADSRELAESLFLALKSRVKSSAPVYLDVPEVNKAAVAMAENFDMKPSFETARMYTGQFPDTPLDRLFGVTSFEIG